MTTDANRWGIAFAIFERILFICFMLPPDGDRRANYRKLLTVFIVVGAIGAILDLVSGFWSAPFRAVAAIAFVALCAVARHAVVNLDRDQQKYGLLLKRLYMAFLLLSLVLFAFVISKVPSNSVPLLLISLPYAAIWWLGWRALRHIDQSPSGDLTQIP